MTRALTLLATIGTLACSGTGAPPSVDISTQKDSIQAWATALESAFNRLGGCGTGDAARALYSADGLVFTTDSATTALSGDALTGLFHSVACTRKATSFKFDSLIVRSLGPGVGVVAGTYVETTTDTANVTKRIRGSAQWILQRGPTGWATVMVSSTEHTRPVK